MEALAKQGKESLKERSWAQAGPVLGFHPRYDFGFWPQIELKILALHYDVGLSPWHVWNYIMGCPAGKDSTEVL